MSLLASIAGAVVGGMISKHNAKSQARTQADLSRENWAYQQSNAHQLEVEDLKKAGLNPILSATNSQMAGMSPVTASDPSNMGNNITSAIQGELERQNKVEMQKNQLEIDKLRAEIERTRAETEKERSEHEAELWKVQGNYYNAKTTNETQESAARVREIDTNIKNSISLTTAQVNHLASGAALNYSQANKVVAEIKNILADTEYKEVNTKELHRILTDPKREIERKAWADALEGNNMLGILHKLNLIGSEVGGVFPSRIGIGYSKR